MNRQPDNNDVKTMEAVYHKTFGGLAFFYRDAELDVRLQELYQPGQILLHPAFTDMTAKPGGMVTSFRYLIASSKVKDLSALTAKTDKAGMQLLPSNSWFKVLDKYSRNGKTQVLLLHIPEDGIEIFRQQNTNIEDEVINSGRKNFDSLLYAPPALHTNEWLERTASPLGMNEKGIFFNNGGAAASAQSTREKGFWKKIFG